MSLLMDKSDGDISGWKKTTESSLFPNTIASPSMCSEWPDYWISVQAGECI